MNPFFFGRSGRQLFGAYEAPAEGSRRGVVLCYPFAREYLLSHASFCFLARQLASTGHHVLRFDYSGTGDSAGELEDSRLEQWIDDVELAMQEVKELAQIEEVTLVGMRYGAVIAATAAHGRSDVDRLVLWDPVCDGRAYLAGASGSAGSAGPATGAGLEVSGVVLTADLRADIERTSLESFGPGLPRTLVLTTGESASEGIPIGDRLLTAGVDCNVAHVSDVPVWRTEWGRGGEGMPVAAARRIVEWLT